MASLQLRQHGAEEDPPGIEAQRGRGILDGRIETAQRCGDRQVEERIIGDDRDEDAALQAAHAGNEADPGIAVHEGRHGERSDRQPGPEPAEGMSVRSVSQASVTASAIDTGMVIDSSRTVLTRSSPTRGRKTRAFTVSQPTS